jgi:ribosomal protein S18 acetylase RimI-like enzyme
MSRTEILRADEGDLHEILELQKLAFQDSGLRYNDPDMPVLTQTLEGYKEEAKGLLILKAVIDGMIIGSVRGRCDDGVCTIGRLAVHPDHWNKGIGRELFTAMENEFNARVFELVTGYRDEKNISFYEKLGYRVCDGPVMKVTDRLYYIRMRKRVTDV